MQINLIIGWLAMLAGALAGAVLGLFFHRDDWLGGYGSYRRRMLRLGHISFFVLGLVNLSFAATAAELSLPGGSMRLASVALAVSVIAMPVCSYLSAWRKPLRRLFPIPVLAAVTGIVAVLYGWWVR